jgi:hypothetical protein
MACDIVNEIYESEYEKMPAKITKVGNKFKVTTPNGTHAKGTTKAKAKAQVKLLNAIDHNPSFKPRKGK